MTDHPADDVPRWTTADERADIARLVAALPADLDDGGPALAELRNRWGISAGNIWPTARRLELALRVVVDRRRREAATPDEGRGGADPEGPASDTARPVACTASQVSAMGGHASPLASQHIEAARRAIALVALRERDDPQAFALALADAVGDPEDAGLVVYGLVELCRFTFGMPPLPADRRLEALEGMAADTARDADA